MIITPSRWSRAQVSEMASIHSSPSHESSQHSRGSGQSEMADDEFRYIAEQFEEGKHITPVYVEW